MRNKDIKAEDKPLTKKETLFVDYLFICKLNGYAAAVRAGYSEHSAYSIASENLRKPHIAKAVQARLSEVHMASDEALALQALIARGDMGELSDENGFFDFKTAKAKGLTRLIRRFKQKTTTYIAKSPSEEDREVHEVEVELYPADIAQERILKITGKLKDPNITINVSLTDD